jgi:hypothetical protein
MGRRGEERRKRHEWVWMGFGWDLDLEGIFWRFEERGKGGNLDGCVDFLDISLLHMPFLS